MRQRKKGRYLKYLPLASMAVITLLLLLVKDEISLEKLLFFAPDSYLLGSLFLLVLYALKSLSVVFPLVILYVCAGVMFPIPWALAISVMGLAVCAIIPYEIGRISGQEAVEALVRRYPKAKQLSDYTRENSLLSTYLLRVVSVLPGDLVSMVLGASKIPFPRYLAGTLLGLFPVMIPSVVLGYSLDSPFSPLFWVSVVLIILVSLSSILVYQKKSGRNSHR